MKPNNASSMAITKSTFFAILLIALPIGLCAQTDDTTPPELIEFGFIPKSIDVGAGPLDVTVTFRITDDLSGVHAAGVVFDSPSGQQSRGLSISVSNLISGDENDGVFQGTITFPELSETGIWHIQGGVFSVDSVGNIRQYSDAEITAMGFPTELEVVSTLDDTTPPELIEFDFIPKSIDVGAGPLDVTVTFRITDDLSGVHAAGVVFDSPSGQQSRGLSISVSNLISGDENDGVYQGTITFPELSETGIWHIQGGVFSVDSVGNIRQYSDAEITAMGFPTELEVVSEPTIEGILFFFEEAVAAGTIYGRGKIPSLDNFRLMLFRQMLETAGWFIEKDKTNAVCRTLDRAYLRCDGEPWPKDFVVGDAVPELAQMVEGLMEYLECD